MDITLVNAISLQFFFLTFGCTGTSGQLRMTPDNTADVVGSSVVLQCQGSVNDPLGGILWNEFITSTTTPTPIVYNGNPVNGTPNSQLYSITGDSSLAQYHLNIELAFLSGGRYECAQFFQSLSASSHVTVLESAPVCSNTIQEDGFVEAGETITYTCEVAYNSTSIDWPPVMNWTGPDVTITDVNKLSTSGGTVASSVNVTGAPGLNGAVYSVRTHFKAYGGSLPADHATNIPTYSHTHSFEELLVQYKPRNIKISSEQDCYIPSNSLTCSADGNPPPSYQWRNLSDNSIQDGPVLTIREGMEGIHEISCEAYNLIRDVNRSSSINATFTVAAKCSGGAGLGASAIAGICVGIIAVIGFITAIVICVKKKKKSGAIN